MNLKASVLAVLMSGFSIASIPSMAQPNSGTPAQKESAKLEAANTIVTEFSQMKEAIPRQLLDLSEGIVIIPKLINAGFVVGGKRGKGIALVRNKQGDWSDPVFVTLTGGSFGFQIGVQAVDLVLVFKSSKTLLDMSSGSFTLGGDLSVAAGPMGRSSTASTDSKLEAEVYSYSRSKGLFAGITLNGAALSVDRDANTAFYEEFENANTLFNRFDNTSREVQDLKNTLKSLK
ncbi:lipid-binding SYLF domain-containing protein [Larkinella sp. C7]|uniref:lipid-binding SYLF domain-containing protein n=1 Tax=Larkinella sp. C7 TaxID=2576607 RepID=UPI001BB0DEF1|nr:lipid-binding SYLF domain-containing protein [Larkinella sp. C7]